MRLRNVFQNVLKCQVHILSSWQLSINWKRAGPGSITIKIVFCSIRSCATTDCDPRIRVYFTYFTTKQFYLVLAAVDWLLLNINSAELHQEVSLSLSKTWHGSGHVML